MTLEQLAVLSVEEAVKTLKNLSTPEELVKVEEDGKEIKICADQAINDKLINILSESGYPILSEEENSNLNMNGATGWIIDPLDGSLNFSRNVPLCAISVAFVEQGKTKIAAVYDLFQNELITSLNIPHGNYKSSKCTSLSSAILCTGFPSRMSFEEKNLLNYVKFGTNFRKVRMLGSAVQSLLHVAKGQFDAYFEKDIMVWDIAAGKLLVEISGGICSEFQGSHENSRIIVASTPNIHDDILKLLNLDKENCI